jgi:hypothetical protein
MQVRHQGRKGTGEILLLAGVVLALAAVLSYVLTRPAGPTQYVRHNKHHAVKPYTFPQGGRQIFPDYRLVALYGTVGSPELGALGQQPLEASITRAKDLAKQYQPYATEHIMPAFEIIATVASAYPTDDGDYSQEQPVATLKPWIDAAQKAGVYVVLDLQPGRSDFLKQAKQYQSLLEEPNVGLALDPEWRLGPTQVPLVQIGSDNITEVNDTIAWLSDLTAQHKLPQKLLVLHQFRLDMLPNREQLDTSRSNLAYVIQMDGQGTQPGKQSTWRDIVEAAPANVHLGWKNFYKMDDPMLDVASTMAITPKPWYVSYQ